MAPSTLKIEKFASRFPSRQIYRRDKSLYLTRHYIYRKPIKSLPSVYLHCFHASDEDLELHSHPWKFSLSLILSGSYKEEYRVGDVVKSRILKPGDFNFITNKKFHRVDLLTPTVWTLFVSGPKTDDWGFWDRYTKAFENWRVHCERNGL